VVGIWAKTTSCVLKTITGEPSHEIVLTIHYPENALLFGMGAFRFCGIQWIIFIIICYLSSKVILPWLMSIRYKGVSYE
jgi:hypothetical protein